MSEKRFVPVTPETIRGANGLPAGSVGKGYNGQTPTTSTTAQQNVQASPPPPPKKK